MSNKVEKLAVIVLVLVLASIAALITVTVRDNYQPNLGTQTVDQELLKPEIIQRFDLNDAGFHKLYEELAMPNTLEMVTVPEITGNLEADNRIRQLAEARGYLFRRVAEDQSQLISVNQTETLQPQAYLDLLALISEAADEGVEIRLRSGFRDVEDQQEIFLSRLEAQGVTTTGITNGSHDPAIDFVLSTTAPPGYSRHHTGYTVDLASGDGAFVNSPGYGWISDNNYQKALKHGFLPSYPKGAVKQGPEPEAWEFVWVGVSLIERQIEGELVE